MPNLYFSKKKIMATKSILTKSSLTFLENYLNNASPTGYESSGQNFGWII
jgi:hypothetical protein